MPWHMCGYNLVLVHVYMYRHVSTPAAAELRVVLVRVHVRIILTCLQAYAIAHINGFTLAGTQARCRPL